MVFLVLPIKLRESDGEGEQHQQEQAQKLAKILQHLTHGDLGGVEIRSLLILCCLV